MVAFLSLIVLLGIVTGAVVRYQLTRAASFLTLPLVVAVLYPAPTWSQEVDGGAASLAIMPVTVIDVREGVSKPGRTVLVEGSRITAVGPAESVEIPADARVVDGTGKYLIPGLWDTHVHSVWNLGENTGVRSMARMDWHFPLLLAHGVTGVRNMNDATADVTLELTNSVKRRLAEGELIGPRLLANGPSIDGDPPLPSDPVVVLTAAEARAVADSLADAGADFIKVYENLPREAYFAVMDRARRRGIPVDGHVPFRVTPEEAAEAGQRTVEHPEALAAGCSTRADAERERFARVLSEYDSLPDDEKFLAQFRYYRALYDTWDPAACTPMIEAYRRNDVALAADLIGFHHVVNAKEILSDTSSMRLVPRATRRNWEEWLDSETARKFQSILRPIVSLQAEQVRLANEAGVVLLAATDVGIPMQVPGISLHEELALLVQAGLTPLEAVRTATLNPARVLGLADSLGTIEAGKLADLVLLEANPLKDITNTRQIAAVILDGRYLDRAALDELLAEVERAATRSEEAPSNSLLREGQSQGEEAHDDTVHVAPPTGKNESGRARLTVPDVTVLGHPEGTVPGQ